MAKYEVTVYDREEIIGSDGNPLSVEGVRALNGRVWEITYSIEAENENEAVRQAFHLIVDEPEWEFNWDDTTFLVKGV